MIGKVLIIRTKYYDNILNKEKIKKRPGLCISDYGSIDNDLVVLPLSTISHAYMRNLKYDLMIEPMIYPKLNLKKTSYIRTHKQQSIARADVINIIGDLKKDYPDKYLEIIALVEEFDKEKIKKALI